MVNKNPRKNWPSAGLDQLGPLHYRTITPDYPQPKNKTRSITTRVALSRSLRKKVKVTLPGEPKS